MRLRLYTYTHTHTDIYIEHHESYNLYLTYAYIYYFILLYTIVGRRSEMCYYRVKCKRLLISRRGNDLTSASVARAYSANIAKFYLILLLYTCHSNDGGVVTLFLNIIYPQPFLPSCIHDYTD